MQIKNGFLFDDSGKQVPYKPTPNRGAALNPSYLIMHYTADTNPDATIGWLTNKAAKASAHLLIDRKGNITQFAAFNVVTWHAGTSAWNGTVGLNSHSIGIELTNAGRLEKRANHFYCITDGKLVNENEVIKASHKNDKGVEAYWQKYTIQQLDAAARVAALLIKTYGLKDVLGHDDIAPGRKSDPGPAFDMAAFKISAGMQPANYKSTTVSLNVRSGPGTSFAILSTLPAGTKVAVEQSTGNWSKINVRSNGINGFVNNQYLK
jgi:N-acetylmuramoyl-L-alanine amidase